MTYATLDFLIDSIKRIPTFLLASSEEHSCLWLVMIPSGTVSLDGRPERGFEIIDFDELYDVIDHSLDRGMSSSNNLANFPKSLAFIPMFYDDLSFFRSNLLSF
ncbi:hypothetical protein CEXT_813841 [Caerostris extrusa]|uniref:Uncharacterized protein n=1 Tax=Caerostris extrusa TaxID=172846 RepID=A0AAV4S5I1_CAEEX|nr:hypothetical protein CEXT_813841 [Caerostris extrusa]